MQLCLALLLLTYGLVAHATPACQSAVSVFPWPRVAPEMIDALTRLAREPRWVENERLTRALTERAVPDRAVAQLFAPATLAHVRAHYGPGARPAPTDSPLRNDLHGLRALLARTLGAIRDDRLQLAWINYMDADWSPTVRLEVARTILSWPDVTARDHFVTRGLDRKPGPDRAVLLAALTAPELISPEVRWRVVRAFVNFHQVDREVVGALNTFDKPHRALLKTWYNDRVVTTKLGHVLKNYEPAWLDQIQSTVHGAVSQHQLNARAYGILLADVGSSTLRARWTKAFADASRAETPRALFAADVLAWTEVSEALRTYAARLRAGEARAVAREAALAEINRAAGPNQIRLAFSLAALDEEDVEFAKGEDLPARYDWSEDDLAAFEAGLKPANQLVR